MTMTDLPLPTTNSKLTRGLSTMTRAEAEHWIASYNAWVGLWNEHERSRDLPLGPEWAEASFLGGAIPKSVLAFSLGDRWGLIRMSSFRAWKNGYRGRADVTKIAWAGWRDARGGGRQ
jgi:hypothetical protein